MVNPGEVGNVYVTGPPTTRDVRKAFGEHPINTNIYIYEFRYQKGVDIEGNQSISCRKEA